MIMRNGDRDVIRRLAGELAELARQPSQREKINGWKRINSLQPHRPMVWITEIPWGEFERKVEELIPVCHDESLRQLETAFRRRLFTARYFPCDEVVDSCFHVPKVIYGIDADCGIEISETRLAQEGGTHILSHHYEAAVKDPEDIEKIKMPEVRYDREESLRRQRFFEELLGDLLDVRLQGPNRIWFNGWDRVVRWTGVTEALMDLSMRPDFIHALMRRYTDAVLSRMRQLEEQGLLDFPHPVARVGSGGAGYTDELPRPDAQPEPGKFSHLDLWGGATAQIFGEVSPAMHEEFALQYEIEVMRKCGLNYYGCCESLHHKMHLMAKVPRLRKISISPWCDVAKAAENAAKKYVFSHKPSPAILAEDKFNTARAEEDIRQRMAQSAGMPCEIIMKDISTVRGDLERVKEWCNLAYRIVNSV